VGGAVVRNRARRRLRALAREVLLREAQPGYDYVLIARAETATRDYADLAKDVRFALKRLRLLLKHADGARA
jgi:ribonuclease P protein component